MGGGASKTPKQEAPKENSSVQPTQQHADQTEPDQNQGVSVSIRPPSGYEDEPSGSRRDSDTPNSPAEGYRSDRVSGSILDPLQENTKRCGKGRRYGVEHYYFNLRWVEMKMIPS